MIDADSAWQRRLDHRLRALWARIPAGDRQRQRINVLLRTSLSDDRLARLGVRVHSVAGDIASGSMVLADVPRLAAAEDILFVELAAPLGHDASNDPPR